MGRVQQLLQTIEGTSVQHGAKVYQHTIHKPNRSTLPTRTSMTCPPPTPPTLAPPVQDVYSAAWLRA